MKFLEKDLEEIIFLSDRDKLSDKGLTDYGKFYRQLRIGNYGISDLVSVRRPFYHSGMKKFSKGHITVYEVKKDKVSVSAFFQALGYLKGIKTYLEKRNKDHLFNFEICLIGKELDLLSSVCYLPSLFDYDNSDTEIELQSSTTVSVYTYEYKIDGLEFSSCENYNLRRKGF
jgi:hypothetical protein